MRRSTVAILVGIAILCLVVITYETGGISVLDDSTDDLDTGSADGSEDDGNSDGSGTTEGTGAMQYTGTLTQTSEGLSLTAYPDAGGWAIGYGHNAGDVYQGEVITQDQADALFQQDIASAEATVNKFVSVPLTQAQYNGLVDWVYNLGAAKAAAGTVFDKVNAGDFTGVAGTLEQYVYSGGQKLAGLLPRRIAEAAGFVGAS